MPDGSAYAVTSTGQQVFDKASSRTISIVGGNSLVNGNLLVVTVSVPDATLPTTTATYDGQNMTKVEQASSDVSSVIWYIFNHGVQYPNSADCIIPIGSSSKHIISWWQFAGMSEVAGTGSETESAVTANFLRILNVSGDNQDLVVWCGTFKPDGGVGYLNPYYAYLNPGYPFQFPAYNDDGYSAYTTGGGPATRCLGYQSAMPAQYYTQKTAELYPGSGFGTVAGVPGWGVPLRQNSYGATTYAGTAVAFRATTRRSTSATTTITSTINSIGEVNGIRQRGASITATSKIIGGFSILESIDWAAAWWADDPAWNPSNGSLINLWPDATPNQFDLVNEEGGVDPAYGGSGTEYLPTFESSVTSLNNKAAVRFDGYTGPESPNFWENYGNSLQQQYYYEIPGYEYIVPAGNRPWSVLVIVDPITIIQLREVVDLQGGATAIWAGRGDTTAYNLVQQNSSIVSVNAPNTYTLDKRFIIGIFKEYSMQFIVDGVSYDVQYPEEWGSQSGGLSGLGLADDNPAPYLDGMDAYIPFAAVYPGDITTDSSFSGLVAWVDDYYGIESITVGYGFADIDGTATIAATGDNASGAKVRSASLAGAAIIFVVVIKTRTASISGTSSVDAAGIRIRVVSVDGTSSLAVSGRVLAVDARITLLTSLGEDTTSTSTVSPAIIPKVGSAVLVSFYVGGAFSALPTVTFSSTLGVGDWADVGVYAENGSEDIALFVAWARVNSAGSGTVTVTAPSSDRRGLAVLQVEGVATATTGQDFLVTDISDFLVTDTGDFLVTAVIGPAIDNWQTGTDLATNSPSLTWGTAPSAASSTELAVVAGRDSTSGVFDQIDLVSPANGYTELLEVGSAVDGTNPHAMEAMWSYPVVGTPSWTWVPISGSVDALAMIALELELDAVYPAAYGGPGPIDVVGNEMSIAPELDTGVIHVGAFAISAPIRNDIAAPVAMGGIAHGVVWTGVRLRWVTVAGVSTLVTTGVLTARRTVTVAGVSTVAATAVFIAIRSGSISSVSTVNATGQKVAAGVGVKVIAAEVNVLYVP